MKFDIYVYICLYLLTTAEGIQLKHPHEINFNNDEILAEFEKIENIRKFNVDTVPYYQRLVKYIFRKQRFQIDPQSDNYFIANIPLRINRKQYELLVETDITGLNVNEIDCVLEEVLRKSSDDGWQQSVTTILYEHYRQEIINVVTPYLPFLLGILLLVILAILNRTFNFSRIKLISIVITSFTLICGISYFMTYLDCMDELEVEQIMMASQDKIDDNPCKKYQAERNDYWASLKTWFSGSSKNECRDYFKKTLIPSKKYCNPLEVLLKWLAKLHMSYFGSIFQELANFIAESTSSMDIFNRTLSKIIMLLFFGISSIFIIIMFLKYVVHSIPNYLSHAAFDSNGRVNSDPSFAILSAKMDAIHQENVEIKREIMVIRERSEEPQPLPPPKKKHKLKVIQESKNPAKSDESTAESN